MDKTHPCFKPCWVTGSNESRLGYVVELGYPISSVYVPEFGVIEVANSKCRFLLPRVDFKLRNFVYERMKKSNDERSERHSTHLRTTGTLAQMA